LEEKFLFFGDIINIDNFEEVCFNDFGDSYSYDISIFDESRDNLMIIFEKYKNEIVQMIKNDTALSDSVMTDPFRIIRHDLDFEDEIDIQSVLDNILSPRQNHYEERARIIIMMEAAKLIETYGMSNLLQNHDQIAKEMRFGLFQAKVNPMTSKEELEMLTKRLEIVDDFGEESIPYIEDFYILRQYVLVLSAVGKNAEDFDRINSLTNKLFEAEKMIKNKDKDVMTVLPGLYSEYEELNRRLIIAKLREPSAHIIDTPDNDSLLLLHFIPRFDNEYDHRQAKFFSESAQNRIKEIIEEKYARPFDSQKDQKEALDMLRKIMELRKRPYDLASRIPIKNRYRTILHTIITKPHTNLSCSLMKPGAVNPHLDRKIAIGFSEVPISAIKTINLGYNNRLDRFSFSDNSAPISYVIDHIERGGTNETLVDWTQVKPSYIMVIKDGPEIEEDLLEEATKYSTDSNLPLIIYDEYTINKKRMESEAHRDDIYIPGMYNISDLQEFAQMISSIDIESMIQSSIETIEGRGDAG